jgi:hypothetical protein
MNIVQTTGISQDGVRMVAAQTKEKELTFTVVNNSSQNASFQLDTENFKEQVFQKFIYSEENRLVNEQDFPVPEKKDLRFRENSTLINVPSKSVVLFTTYKY